ncbi:MAG: tetratricopeptide repeat protein [Bacteroidota bacterium]
MRKCPVIFSILLILAVLIPTFSFGQSSYEKFQAQKYFFDGYSKYQRRQFDGAVRDFTQAILLNPDHEKAFRYRGESYLGLKEYEAALDDFDVAIEINPEEAALYNWRGMAFAKLNHYRLALKDFDYALEIDPAFENARKNRSWVLDRTSLPYRDNYYDDSDQAYEGVIREKERQNSDYPSRSQSSRQRGKKKVRNQPTGSLIQAYRFPRALKKPENLYIEKIEVERRKTLVYLVVNAPKRSDYTFEILSPSSLDAFVIQDKDFRRSYKLRDVHNAEFNTEINIPRGRQRLVVLTFDAIDRDAEYIHLLQGNRTDDKAWNFYDIELRKDTSFSQN